MRCTIYIYIYSRGYRPFRRPPLQMWGGLLVAGTGCRGQLICSGCISGGTMSHIYAHIYTFTHNVCVYVYMYVRMYVCVHACILLGPSWPAWSHLGAILGPSWGYLGPSWGHLGPTSPIMDHLRPSWDHLAPKTGPRYAEVRRGTPRYAEVRRGTRGLGAIWGPSGGHLGAILRPSRAILESFWAISGLRKERKDET